MSILKFYFVLFTILLEVVGSSYSLKIINPDGFTYIFSKTDKIATEIQRCDQININFDINKKTRIIHHPSMFCLAINMFSKCKIKAIQKNLVVLIKQFEEQNSISIIAKFDKTTYIDFPLSSSNIKHKFQIKNPNDKNIEIICRNFERVVSADALDLIFFASEKTKLTLHQKDNYLIYNLQAGLYIEPYIFLGDNLNSSLVPQMLYQSICLKFKWAEDTVVNMRNSGVKFAI